MKFLLVLAVVLVAFWIWRNNRINERPADPPARAPGKPMAMLACDHCGTHLPEVEAIKGQHGVYCCQEHRRQNEGPSP